jgi:hypothetical protein
MLLALLPLLVTALDILADHPDLSRKLLQGAIDAIRSIGDHEPTVEQLTAVQSGMAAACANAVQEAKRREKTPVMTRG